MIDYEKEQEVKELLAERYTSMELCDLLNVPIEDIINEYWDKIVDNLDWLLE